MTKTYFLMPGNPAISNYYNNWANEIKKVDPKIKVIYASANILFNKNLDFVDYEQAMFSHYEKLFSKLIYSRQITIIAHSVGGYFALRLLEKYPKKIKKVILVYPYIGESTINPLNFVYLPYLIDRFLPLSETICFCKNIIERYDKSLTYLSKNELKICLRLGLKQCTYFNNYKFNTKRISKSKNKIYFIYNVNDRWCPKATIKILKPISNFKKVNLPHDFVLTENGRKSMAKAVLSKL